MSPQASNKKALAAILEFVKGGNLQPGSKPGFAHALKLSYNTIRTNDLRWDGTERALTYRYRFGNGSAPSADRDSPELSLGVLTAVMDELSTNACFGVGQPSAPGLSLHMNMEWTVGDPASLFSQLPVTAENGPGVEAVELDSVNTVTKLGRTVSFTRTEFVHPVTRQVVAHGTHVKFMPTGNFLLDLVFNKPWAFALYRKIFKLDTVTPPLYDERPLAKDVIGSHLEQSGLGKASFRITREHTNPFGGLHGGCHAVLMEIVALPLARSLFNKRPGNNDAVVFLSSQKIDYLSAGKVGTTIDISAELIGDEQQLNVASSTIPLRVRLARSDGRVLSDGALVFSVAPNATQSKL